jgi:nucleotide-binding universal stress UspA family protein
VLRGDIAAELTRAVDSVGADLLVVGVPTARAVSRALFGTTAARLLRVVDVPMLAVPVLAAPSVGQDSAPTLRQAA